MMTTLPLPLLSDGIGDWGVVAGLAVPTPNSLPTFVETILETILETFTETLLQISTPMLPLRPVRPTEMSWWFVAAGLASFAASREDRRDFHTQGRRKDSIGRLSIKRGLGHRTRMQPQESQAGE